LRILHGVRIVRERPSRFDSNVIRTLDRNYPHSLQRLDDQLYMGLGLLPAQKSIRSALVTSAYSLRAVYDPVARVIWSRTSPTPGRSQLLRELARALVDQNYNLRRLNGLRERNRDAALAAQAVVDGVAAIASGARLSELQGTPMQRFLAVEQNAGIEFGRSLLVQLRYIGGRSAMGTALRTFPRTTAEVLQVDRFLERDPASPVSLVAAAGDSRVTASETFGELDVLALLSAFDIPGADEIASGWGGGKIALYTGPHGNAIALVLRWLSEDDAAEWSASIPRYVGSAFPTAVTRRCPAIVICWLDGTHELASASSGTTTVFASGVNAELIADAVTAPK
jgi:hypothetical protein